MGVEPSRNMGVTGEVKVGRRTIQSKAETLITLPIWSSQLLWGLPEASGTLGSSREAFGAVVCAVTALLVGRAAFRRMSWTWTKGELSPQVPGSVSSSFNRENPQQCPGSLPPSSVKQVAPCSGSVLLPGPLLAAPCLLAWVSCIP